MNKYFIGIDIDDSNPYFLCDLSETDFKRCGKRCSQRIKIKRGDFYGNYIQSK